MAEDCCDAVDLFIVVSALVYTKMLYLKSMRVAKSHFGVEDLTIRSCQGNLWHFSNKKLLVAHGFQVLVLSLKVQWMKILDVFLHGKHIAPVCTSRFLPFPLNKNFRGHR